MEWKQSKGQWATGEKLYLGKCGVGGTHYSALVTRGDPKKYQAVCLLPGRGRTDFGRYETQEEAKAAVVEAVTWWLESAGLTIKG